MALEKKLFFFSNRKTSRASTNSTLSITRSDSDFLVYQTELIEFDIRDCSRFEYPLQSTLKKRRSRSPKDEKLQVLHVQQVAEVELLSKQTSGSKSLCSSDSAECKEKNTAENKQSTQENISKAMPAKLQTLKSFKIQENTKKENEIPPFSKLYEKLKHEIKRRKILQEGNLLQKTGKEDGKSVLLEPNAHIPSSYAYELGITTKEKETAFSLTGSLLVLWEKISTCTNYLCKPILTLLSSFP
ncbi:uncharacterized protein LOC107306740 isoform X2 [Coturnix japonica]|uniref:uncharacterized protein LOC107306740 isoform X2 n=1 Tax=Coturnix japonica TaxID=93934 RepID=UPI0013A5DE69|nr:uncharacterized protein LOC107306740 isoform X2 [Coturnix japonica]